MLLITHAVNTLGLKQNGHYCADSISKSIFFYEKVKIWFKFHWSLFLRVQLTMNQHWFGYWFGDVQGTNHYLNQWWYSLPMHICIIQPQWVNTNLICLQTCHDQCSMGVSLLPGSCMTKQLVVAEKCQVVTSTGLISGVCVMFQWRLRQADVLTLHWKGSSVIWRKFLLMGTQKFVKMKMMIFHFSVNGLNCFEGH